MKEKIFTRNFWCTFFAMISCSMVMYMLMGTITEYAATFGASTTLAGLASGSYIIGGLCTRLYSGGALVRYGWRKVGVVFLTLHFLACCCYFFAENMAALIIIRLIHGFGFGAGSNAVLTIGMSVLPKSRYGEAMGYLMLSTTLSIAIGPYLGGVVYDSFGPYGCFAASAILSLLTILFSQLITLPNDALRATSSASAEPVDSAPPTGLRRFVEPSAVPISFCITFVAFGYVAVMSFSRLYGAQTGLATELSYFFLIYAVVLLFTRPLAGKIQDRYGDNYACYPGIFLQAGGLFLLAWKPCVLTIALCAFGCAMGYGVLNSCYSAIISGHSDPRRRSYSVATFFMFCDIGVGAGPLLLGGVAAVGGYHALYYVAALLALGAFPVYYLAWGRKGDTAKRCRPVSAK